MRTIGTLLVAAAVLMAAPATARSQDDVAKAKKLFKEAEAHFAKEEYREALEAYKQAFEAKPLPGFHFNIAQCHRELGEHRPAVEHYEAYLASSANPANKADAERLLQLSRDALAEEERLKALEEQPPEPVVQPEPKPEPKPEPVKKGRRRLNPLYFWGGVGLTGAMLLTGTITGGMALSKSSKFKDESTAHDDLKDLKDSGESLRTASTVTFTLGLVAAAGTAALYFFTDFGSKEKAVAASPVPGGAVVSMGGRF